MDHFELMGFRVTDAVTGITGVVASISFDISGCVQALVVRGAGGDGKLNDPLWFDTKRLARASESPVMSPPDFGNPPGGQVLPPPPNGPR